MKAPPAGTWVAALAFLVWIITPPLVAAREAVAQAGDPAGDLGIAAQVRRIGAAIGRGSDGALRRVVDERELTPPYESGLALLQLPLIPVGAPSTVVGGETGAN